LDPGSPDHRTQRLSKTTILEAIAWALYGVQAVPG